MRFPSRAAAYSAPQHGMGQTLTMTARKKTHLGSPEKKQGEYDCRQSPTHRSAASEESKLCTI